MSDHKDPVSLFSHIFKTPLTSVKAASDILAKHLGKTLPLKERNILDMVIRNSRTLEMRINKLLEMMQGKEAGVLLDISVDQLEEVHSLTWEEPEEEEGAAPAAAAAPVATRRKTILVADDTEDIRNLVVGALKDDGYNVEEAKDGETAWYVIKNFRPHLLVLDGLMPKRDGFSLSAEAKKLDPQRYVPRVILMTAVYKKSHYQSEAMHKYGVDKYVLKPFEIGQLISYVHELLGDK